MILYDFKCSVCGLNFEALTDMGQQHESCPKCDGRSTRAWIHPPMLRYLHMGVDAKGNPTSGDKWAKMHEDAARRDPDGEPIQW